MLDLPFALKEQNYIVIIKRPSMFANFSVQNLIVVNYEAMQVILITPNLENFVSI